MGQQKTHGFHGFFVVPAPRKPNSVVPACAGRDNHLSVQPVTRKDQASYRYQGICMNSRILGLLLHSAGILPFHLWRCRQSYSRRNPYSLQNTASLLAPLGFLRPGVTRNILSASSAESVRTFLPANEAGRLSKVLGRLYCTKLSENCQKQIFRV